MENAPPEEKPLMAMVCGLMLSLSSAEPETEVAVSAPVTIFLGKNIRQGKTVSEREEANETYC